jgi:transcriptional regulator with XRE-family HTH domain
MEQPVKERLKITMRERGVKIPVLAQQTGIPKGRIYGWYRDNSNPKAEDLQVLEGWLNKETSIKSKENVPRATFQNEKANNEELNNIPLHDLISSNNKLAQASLVQAEKDKIRAQADLVREEKEKALVESNAELTRMLKATAGSGAGKSLVEASRLIEIQELLAEIATGALSFDSREEALREIGIRLKLHEGDKGSSVGIRTGAGRKSTAG